MNLTIDIGNTCIKTIVFEGTIPVYRNISDKLTVQFLDKLRKNYPVSNCLVSSVINLDSKLLGRLKMFPGYRRLSASTKIPVKNRYQTPATLGNDRLANVIGASFLFPQKNVLVIDAGTCIKYDFLNSRTEYLGGSISPGMHIRFKALNQFTGKLPLIKDSGDLRLTGRNTIESMQTGVMNGILEEIKGFISLYKKKYKNIKVILTGGDGFRFAMELNLSIFAAADLVNIGLN